MKDIYRYIISAVFVFIGFKIYASALQKIGMNKKLFLIIISSLIALYPIKSKAQYTVMAGTIVEYKGHTIRVVADSRKDPNTEGCMGLQIDGKIVIPCENDAISPYKLKTTNMIFVYKYSSDLDNDTPDKYDFDNLLAKLNSKKDDIISKSSSSNYNKMPIATGTYTISQQGQSATSGNYTGVAGTDLVVTIEFFDDGISVGGLWCEYAEESNGRKKYNDPMSFGGSSTAYYVDSHYNVQKQSTFSSPFGTDWFNYKVVKGNVSIPKNQPYNGGGYSNGSHSSTGSSSNGNSNSGSSNTYKASCPHCHGSGKCNTCNGRHRYLNPLTNKYITCPNCKPDGACSYCGGTGKKH